MAEQRTRRSGLQRRSGNLVQSAAAGLQNVTQPGVTPVIRPGTGLRRSRRQAQRPGIITARQESLERARSQSARDEARLALQERGQEFREDLLTGQQDLRERSFLESLRARGVSEGLSERADVRAERAGERAGRQLGLSEMRFGAELGLRREQGERAERELLGRERGQEFREGMTVAEFEERQEERQFQRGRQAEQERRAEGEFQLGQERSVQQLEKGSVELEQLRKGGGRRTGLRGAAKSAIETTPNLLINRAMTAAGLRRDQFRDAEGELLPEGEVFLESLRDMEDQGIDIRDPRAIQKAIQDAGFQTDEQQEIKLEAQLETLPEDDARRAGVERQLRDIREREQRTEAEKTIAQDKRDEALRDPAIFRAQLDDMAVRVSPAGNAQEAGDALVEVQNKLDDGDFDDDSQLRIDTYDALVFPIAEAQGVNLDREIRRENFKDNKSYLNAITKAWDDHLIADADYSQSSINLAFAQLAQQFPNRKLTTPTATSAGRKLVGFDVIGGEDARDAAIQAVSKQLGMRRTEAEIAYRNAFLRAFKAENFEDHATNAREQFKLGETSTAGRVRSDADAAARRDILNIQ